MKKARIEIEYNDYSLTVSGLVNYEQVMDLRISFNDLDRSDYPKGQELRDIKEFCIESLIEHCNNPELEF